MPTADPKLNPEPATKSTEILAAETVHGHATIHSRSANPRTDIVPANGDKNFSDGQPPWSAQEGRAKGGTLKNPEGGSDEVNRPSCIMFPDL